MANTYTVTFKCPQCGERLSFEKKRNGVSPQARKLRVYSEHRPECAVNDLNKTLTDITLTDIARLSLKNAEPAPNEWEKYRDGELIFRGTPLPFDYEVHEHGDDVRILFPISIPAKEWLCAKMGGNAPRWMVDGYAMKTHEATAVMAGMKRDGLISEPEYEEAMNLAEEKNQQDWDFAEYQGEER